MRKLYKLATDLKMTIEPDVNMFLDPEYIFLPIDELTFFEPNQRVLKNKVFLETKECDYASSISGDIVELCSISINNKKQDSFKIENDYEEAENSKVAVNKEDTNQFYKLIQKNVLFDKLNKKEIKHILVNGVEDEPYTHTESFILKNNIDSILETLEFIAEMFKVSKSQIALKNTMNDNINSYLSNIGSYPSLDLVILEDLYLIGREEFLLDKLNLKAENTLVIKPSELLEIRNYLKFSHPKAEKYISVIDLVNGVTKVFYTKKYITVKQLLDKLKFDYDEEFEYIKNGILSGLKLKDINEIIDDSFDSLVITAKVVDSESKCISCGCCKKVCPYYVKSIFKKNTKCIDCGLCSYYCPSKINLRKKEKSEKNE